MLERSIVLASAIVMLLVCPVIAAGDGLVSEDNGGYVVKSGVLCKSDDNMRTVYSSISQGETNWHYKQVSSSTNVLNINLNWGNPSNSLSLKIYTADGEILGPYYDNADGRTDGKISLSITNPDGIASGRWDYKVYGYSVSGTEDYSI
ncbi:hypothetical protein [Methanoplanus limicola]|uniref:Peptidase domain-containing protein n=1 Tax=Methanoplanus limicola DSM 2279 TaxID=937775 RepID=H1Z4L3_9EURY|nr:hypothetical protein [Methanoplanus limicola]EHQ36761.1 hypothetical protein Metlim_2725 [Methanoplanus limicola DSM 2279]